MKESKLNTKGLFITTIIFACIIALFIIGFILIIIYSCNICTSTPAIPKHINGPSLTNAPTNYVSPMAGYQLPPKPNLVSVSGNS